MVRRLLSRVPLLFLVAAQTLACAPRTPSQQASTEGQTGSSQSVEAIRGPSEQESFQRRPADAQEKSAEQLKEATTSHDLETMMDGVGVEIAPHAEQAKPTPPIDRCPAVQWEIAACPAQKWSRPLSLHIPDAVGEKVVLRGTIAAFKTATRRFATELRLVPLDTSATSPHGSSKEHPRELSLLTSKKHFPQYYAATQHNESSEPVWQLTCEPEKGPDCCDLLLDAERSAVDVIVSGTLLTKDKLFVGDICRLAATDSPIPER